MDPTPIPAIIKNDQQREWVASLLERYESALLDVTTMRIEAYNNDAMWADYTDLVAPLAASCQQTVTTLRVLLNTYDQRPK